MNALAMLLMRTCMLMCVPCVSVSTADGTTVATPLPIADDMPIVDIEAGNANTTAQQLQKLGRVSEVAASMAKMWHCVTDDWTDPHLSDVRFFLYTRRNRNRHEEVVLTVEQHDDSAATITTTAATTVPSTSRRAPPPNRSRRRHRQVSSQRPSAKPAPPPHSKIAPSSPLRSSYFNMSVPTKVVIHGYTESTRDRIIVMLKRAYLARGDYNVLLVDWRNLAKPPCYNFAVRCCKFVGAATARLIDLLQVPPSSVHIVGFSLGAHVAGFVGNHLHGGNLERITGLDPALPYYSTDDRLEKLDRTDASFVDVIHTNGGMLGQALPVGHADYYPNGGSKQPGCDVSDVFCSHNRAPEFFLESITSRVAFRAVGCPSFRDFKAGLCDNTRDVTIMGEQCTDDAIGQYFLYTERDRPYALG